MEFVRRCRSCPNEWDIGVYCPECGSLSDQVPVYNRERAKEKRMAYAKAKTFEEVQKLTARFGDKPGYAHFYWKARERSRG